MAIRAQLRRYGNNLNQAARILHAGGDPPEWLSGAITLTTGWSSASIAPSRTCSPTPPARMTSVEAGLSTMWNGCDVPS